MKRIVLIDDCNDCPYFSSSYLSYIMQCDLQEDDLGCSIQLRYRDKETREYNWEETMQGLLKNCPLATLDDISSPDLIKKYEGFDK